MLKPSEFVRELNAADVDFFCGVPDSLLKNFCAYVTDACAERHVIAANEGGAVALAAGHYLATGQLACVYMQNSGQGNAVNPLASLADPDVYSIPMILLVGWRGEPGVHDEPQHVKQGKVTIPLFQTLNIPVEILPDDSCAALDVTRRMVFQAKRESRPVALVVRKGLFEEYKLQTKNPDVASRSRESVIEDILGELPRNAVVISTTGMISRELYETRIRRGEGHGQDFLTVGSMGHAIMIALGIAKAQPDRLVVCLDGDGASIMQMGNMAIAGQSRCGNLLHIVLNNAAHDSVGGQPTVGGTIDLTGVASSLGYAVTTGDSIESVVTEIAAQRSLRPRFIEIKVAKGARKDLGRPKEKPGENKELFMETLSR